MVAAATLALQFASNAPAEVRPRYVGGAGSSLHYGHLTDLDQNSELRNEKWYGDGFTRGKAAQMMTDAHVRRSVAAIVSPIVAAKWDFKAASKEPIDLEIADFCRWTFLERLKWAQAIRDSLHYLRDGFALLEQTDDIAPIPASRFPSHPGGGIGVVVTGLHYRPSWTIDGFLQSKTDPARLRAVRQLLPGSDEERPGYLEIPAERLIRFSWEQEGANFAGFAPLRSAYGEWKTKMVLRIVEAIRHEREHTGVPTITLPEGASEDQIRDAQVALAEMRANERGFLILPNGFAFAFNTTQATTDINTTIERCDFGIAHNLGVGFTLLGKGGTAGSYALASTQSGQYEIDLDNHVRFIEDTFNLGADGWSTVERTVRLNYGPDVQIPRLIARNMPTRDWSRILPIVNNLLLSGGLRGDDVLEDFIRDATYLPAADPSTARENAASASAQNLKAPGMTNGDVKGTQP
jgi:hypothetical protein